MESLVSTYGLDACAVIAYLRAEPGAAILKALIEQPTTLLARPVCNLGAVSDDFFRDSGLPTAQTAWTNTLALPLTWRRNADDAFIQRVRGMKVEEQVSCADALALALAERLNVPLMTTDHHAWDAIEPKGHVRSLWLR